MSVRKRKWVTRLGEAKEAWVVDYTDQQGDRHIRTFERKKEADDYHATVKVHVREGVHVAPHRSITVAAAAENWIKSAESAALERATIEVYRGHARIHILPRIGKVKLANLTLPKVEAFRDDLLNGLSRPMARKVWVSFKSILRTAKCAHVVDGVKTIKARPRGERVLVEQGRDFPTPAEIKRLVEEAKGSRQRALVLTAALCGLRASELRGLRWSDVKLETSELEVRQRADRVVISRVPVLDHAVAGKLVVLRLNLVVLRAINEVHDLIRPFAGEFVLCRAGVALHANNAREASASSLWSPLLGNR